MFEKFSKMALLILVAVLTNIAFASNGFKLVKVSSESSIVAVRSDEPCSPFCDDHRITFMLKEPAFVSVRVTTPMGVIVRQLSAQALSDGEYTIGWDGSDDRGADAGSGVFLYTIKTEVESPTLASH